MRRPRRRMRSSIQIDGPVEPAHELDMIGNDIPRQWILFLENANAAETAPLVRRRVGPALVFRSSPQGFCRSIRPHPAGIVEWNPEVIAQRRLSLTANLPRIFVALQDPLSRNVGRDRRAGGLSKCRNTCQHNRQEENEPACHPDSTGLIHYSAFN